MINEVFMPALSSTMTEGKIVSWLKSPGDKVEKGETVVVVESDKADMDVESFYEGYLAVIVVPAGESAPVGQAIAFLAETEAEMEEAKQKAQGVGKTAPKEQKPSTEATIEPTASAPTEQVTLVRNSDRPIVSPRARKLAKELKIDLATVKGTGPNGRIVAGDIENAAGRPVTPPIAATPIAPTIPVLTPRPPPTATPVNVPVAQVVPFNTLQNAVNKNMMASLAVPTFRVGYTITTDNLDQLYKQIKSKGVTMSALLAKAVALTLVKHPKVNASYSDQGIQHPGAINIAVAVAMDDGGLITPVLANADKLDIYTLSRTWKDLVDRARSKQLQPHEYNSGTFTISNLGMFGVDRFDAILPPGTGAIISIGASRPQIVATPEGMMGVKKQMQVNLTSDHRVIYGADAASFLKDLAKLIETNAQSLTM
jgi:pyruvate dehydrogenase E2 component (dihydrolipoamide acetyltransferase)